MTVLLVLCAVIAVGAAFAALRRGLHAEAKTLLGATGKDPQQWATSSKTGPSRS
jgi:hypothetical protein